MILFLIGMLFARFEGPVVAWLKRGYWLKLAVAFAAFAGFYRISGLVMNKFSYWVEFGSVRSLGIAEKYACLASQTFLVIAFVVFVFMVMMKARSINPVTSFLGKIALEGARTKLAQLTENFEAWAAVSEGADYPQGQ